MLVDCPVHHSIRESFESRPSTLTKPKPQHELSRRFEIIQSEQEEFASPGRSYPSQPVGLRGNRTLKQIADLASIREIFGTVCPNIAHDLDQCCLSIGRQLIMRLGSHRPENLDQFIRRVVAEKELS